MRAQSEIRFKFPNDSLQKNLRTTCKRVEKCFKLILEKAFKSTCASINNCSTCNMWNPRFFENVVYCFI